MKFNFWVWGEEAVVSGFTPLGKSIIIETYAQMAIQNILKEKSIYEI